ncbi:hypothetical protein GDO81_021903 [Engystomops pustulosus]|uniref:Uncharacterized protein n=1 Tax=Engystomops pustulosus TaxID=76066 RepID=A0AAV6ZUK4_ENGPU|nr:hypothetical protein GDO81_021903 [Engystomops pustulosus]
MRKLMIIIVITSLIIERPKNMSSIISRCLIVKYIFLSEPIYIVAPAISLSCTTIYYSVSFIILVFLYCCSLYCLCILDFDITPQMALISAVKCSGILVQNILHFAGWV